MNYYTQNDSYKAELTFEKVRRTGIVIAKARPDPLPNLHPAFARI